MGTPIRPPLTTQETVTVNCSFLSPIAGSRMGISLTAAMLRSRRTQSSVSPTNFCIERVVPFVFFFFAMNEKPKTMSAHGLKVIYPTSKSKDMFGNKYYNASQLTELPSTIAKIHGTGVFKSGGAVCDALNSSKSGLKTIRENYGEELHIFNFGSCENKAKFNETQEDSSPPSWCSKAGKTHSCMYNSSKHKYDYVKHT